MKPEELQSISLLRGMEPEALARLAGVLQEQEFADGQRIFAEGDPGDSMYFITAGHIRIEVPTGAGTAGRKVLTVLEAGDYFGEMSLLDQKPRSASAVASGCSRTLRLSKAAFDELHAHGGRAGIDVLFAMIRTSSERIRRLSAHLVVYDEIGKAIGESKSLQELLDVVLGQLAGASSADWGLLILRSQFSAGLELRSALRLTLTPDQQSLISEGRGFVDVALQEPDGRLFADFDRELPADAVPRLGFETPSLLWAPISVEGGLLGLIVLGGRTVGQFDLNGLNLVKGVARQAAQAILNARHREEEQARSRHARQYVRF